MIKIRKAHFKSATKLRRLESHFMNSFAKVFWGSETEKIKYIPDIPSAVLKMGQFCLLSYSFSGLTRGSSSTTSEKTNSRTMFQRINKRWCLIHCTVYDPLKFSYRDYYKSQFNLGQNIRLCGLLWSVSTLQRLGWLNQILNQTGSSSPW